MRNSEDVDNFGYGDGTYNPGIGDGYGYGAGHIDTRVGSELHADGEPCGCFENGDGYSPEWEDDEDFSE